MPDFKKNKSAFMMKGKSPIMKALIGNQNKLPVELQEKKALIIWVKRIMEKIKKIQ